MAKSDEKRGNGEPTPAEAASRVKGEVVVPEFDDKGERAFDLEPQTRVRIYRNSKVPVGPEHVFAIKPWGIVTVDGQKLAWAK